MERPEFSDDVGRRDFLKLGAIAGATVGSIAVLDAAITDGDPGPGGTDGAPDPTPTATPGNGQGTATPTEDQETATETETETPDEPDVRYAEDYGTVVQAVEAGADPEGSTPINDLVARHAGDDTLLSFPAGTYLIRPFKLRDYDHLAIAAAGETRPTFVAEADSFSGTGRFVVFESVTDFLLDGIDFDFCREQAGGKLTVIADGAMTLRNVAVEASCSEHLQVLGLSVRATDGTGLVENFRSVNRGTNRGLTGIYVGKPHAGELTFRHCELLGFSDNGLYASAPGLPGGENGVVHVEGGTFNNSNVSNVRLGSTGSTARDVSITVDSSPSVEPVNVRGIRLRRQSDQVIENCDITYGEDAGDTFGAIVFHPDNGGAVVRDTTITVDRDNVPAIYAPYNSSSFDSPPVFENVTIDGIAAGGYAAQFIGREGVTFRNCRIEQPGTDRHGIRIANNPGGRIVDCHIEVDGLPILIDDTTAEIRNTTIANPDGERTIDSLSVSDEQLWPA
jgi:hypothetical protein